MYTLPWFGVNSQPQKMFETWCVLSPILTASQVQWYTPCDWSILLVVFYYMNFVLRGCTLLEIFFFSREIQTMSIMF